MHVIGVLSDQSHGLAQISMEELADRLGVTRRTLLRDFNHLELLGLIETEIRQNCGKRRERWARISAGTRSVVAKG